MVGAEFCNMTIIIEAVKISVWKRQPYYDFFLSYLQTSDTGNSCGYLVVCNFR